MLAIFWDASGVIYTDFLTKGLTMNSDRRPHYSARTQDFKGKLKFAVVPKPSYSPDLAPSDYRLFPKLKETLKGFNEYRISGNLWQMDTQSTRIFLLGRNGEMERTIEQMCSC
ncbi:hypothetical protein TNCV_4159731 [Trichonephila clavipes]|nr:hypothetical protein TNCV_4159731 [Trichonephila clavipes]